MLNEQISPVGPYLKIIGICYYAIVLQEEKKTQIHLSHNFMKTHVVEQTNHRLNQNYNKNI